MNKESERVRRWVESKSKECPRCEGKMRYTSKTCRNCSKNQEVSNEIKKLTIGEYRERIIKSGLHRSSLHAHIRNFARTWFRELQRSPCKSCGYSKHVELCHIKSLSSFSDDTILEVVNSSENLLPLCRNCHWEFDNKIISIDGETIIHNGQ